MSDLTFHTPPALSGQTIETSYASFSDSGESWILRLTVDRSNQTGRIDMTPFPKNEVDWAQAHPECPTAPEDRSWAGCIRCMRGASLECDVLYRLKPLEPPFIFEPWNEEPPFPADTLWIPCEVVSDGEQWCLSDGCLADADGYLRPLGFALLDSGPYGALQRPDGSHAFMRLANDNWTDGESDCGAELAWHAFDYPEHRARWERQELCCECGCDCEQTALVRDVASGVWLCAVCACGACLEAGTEAGTEEGAEGEQAIHPGPIPDWATSWRIRFRGHCVGALDSTPTLTSGYPTVHWGALQKFTRSLWPVGHIFEHDGRRWRVERNTYSQGDEHFPDVYTFIAVPLGPELPLSAMPGVLEALASEIPLAGPTRESERKVLAAMARRDRG